MPAYRLSTADRAAMRKRDLAAIHKMAAQLGLDTHDPSPASEYRSLLQQVGGAASAADLSADGRGQVIRHLMRLVGTAPRSLSPRQFIELLWQQLGTAGKLDDPSAGGLSKFIHRMTGVHLASGLTAVQSGKVIEALKAWKARGAAAE